MQPAKLGAAYWCLFAGVILGLTLTQSAGAQTPPEAPQPPNLQTQQQANEKIRELSARTMTPAHDYVIGTGDVVSVEVYEVPELSRDLRVSLTGTIGIPLVPTRLYVVGLTEMQLQRKIAEVLEANGLVTRPQVLVAVKEKKSKPITIVGAVARPMVFQADHPVTLVEVLAEAGGIAADAGNLVLVTRGAFPANLNSAEPPEISPEDTSLPVTNPAVSGGEPKDPGATIPDAAKEKNPEARQQPNVPGPEVAQQKPAENGRTPASTPPAISSSDVTAPLANTITVNLSELLERGDLQNNIPLQAGDVVTVPHAGIVYALGAVTRPGGFVARDDRAQLSTLKILALAGGTTRVAKKSQAVIIRKDESGKQQAIPVDLRKIVKREAEDVRLLPSDILYVPDSPAKAALIRAGEIGLGVGTSLLIYRVGTGH